MPSDRIVSDGTMIIHKVSARNGKRQTKKLKTTAPNIKITCFRYFSTLLRLPCDVIPGLSIKCFAMTVYSTSNMMNGSIKKSDILPTKKKIDQNDSTDVRHTATVEPSKYSSNP